MKKRTIIALIVAVLLVVAGGILVVLGLSFAGDAQQDAGTVLNQSEHRISERLDSILIDTEDCNVNFVLDADGEASRVVIRERESASHSVRVENGTLIIKMVDSRNWRDFIGLNWESMEMTVYLTQKAYVSVRVDTATGYIQIPEDFQLEEVRLHSDTGRIRYGAKVTGNLACDTATGGITVRSVDAKLMTLESNTGSIHVSGAAGTEIHLENDTGKTELEDVSCKLLSSESETGDVMLRNVVAEDHLQVITDTGDVVIENSDAGNVNIETDTGDVSGHFLTPKWFSAHSDTGNVQVPHARDGGECRIESDTGDIHFE